MAGGWSTAARVSDSAIAQLLVDLLVSEGVPARVAGDTVLLGVSRECRILVPDEYLHRAKWLLAQQATLTDAELESLATGEPDQN